MNDLAGIIADIARLFIIVLAFILAFLVLIFLIVFFSMALYAILTGGW